jgi:hypothetical protein
MFALLKKARNANLPLDCILKAFDVMIVPILLYGSEIWGYSYPDVIEKVHLKFMKLVTGLRKSTPNFMVYGELGRKPMSIQISKRMIHFWHRINNPGNVNKLSSTLYVLLNNDTTHDNFQIKWINHIKGILNSCGLSYVFKNPQDYDRQWLVNQVETILQDQFTQKWRSEIENSTKGVYYNIIKQSLTFEKYLLLPKQISIPILKFRACNHNLPIETGRWRQIPRENRKCPLCNSPVVGDEFHYLFKCEFFSYYRSFAIPDKYLKFPNLYTFRRILATSKVNELRPLSKFFRTIFNCLV